MFCLLCLGDIVEDSADSLCSDVIEFPIPNPSQHLPFRTVHEQLTARYILSHCSFSECGDSDCDYVPDTQSKSESAVDSCDDAIDSERQSSNAECDNVTDLVQNYQFPAYVWNTITEKLKLEHCN